MAQIAPVNLTTSYKSPSISHTLVVLNANYDFSFMESLCFAKVLRFLCVIFYYFLTTFQTIPVDIRISLLKELDEWKTVKYISLCNTSFIYSSWTDGKILC